MARQPDAFVRESYPAEAQRLIKIIRSTRDRWRDTLHEIEQRT